MKNERYNRILWFFARLIGHIIWWDLIGSQFPVWGGYSRRTRPERWRMLAGRFRLIAVEMGGVLIKLGQFFSSRVDVLPFEVTQELQGLQDEVPPADQKEIELLLWEELGNWRERFSMVDLEPLAAASFGQTYRARLQPEEGEIEGQPVILKVQRPGIERLVEIDLAALGVVAHWVMRYRPLRKRADVPALMKEFGDIMRLELDYEQEADNADLFRKLFAKDERIYAPKIYREHLSPRVLVLEDVTSIKVIDFARLKEEGVDLAEIAETLLYAYFQQVFKYNFFHADPHPGNLFIRPWGKREEGKKRPFQLIFIDFGMMGHIPEGMGDQLRQILVAIAQQDVVTMTKAYDALGFFLPGTDLERVIEVQESVLQRIWGRKLLELARPDPKEIRELTVEFRDLLFEFPFQVPQDFIYLGRALGMISGLVSQLNPEIDPWDPIERYGKELLGGGLLGNVGGNRLIWDTVVAFTRPFWDTPGRLYHILQQLDDGTLQLGGGNGDLGQRLDRLDQRMGQLQWVIVGSATLIAGAIIYVGRLFKSESER